MQALYNSADEDIEYGDFVVEKALRNEFPYADVWDGLIAAKQEDKSITSDYGGCGPIAAIGAFDFFARTLGYDDTIGDLHKSDNRIDLAKNVFLSINTYVLPSDKGTLTLPSDYEEGFNNLAKKYGIPVTATSHGLSIGGKREEYLELIKTQIDNGMPVTMFTAVTNGKKGVFAGHYVTICSYEEWIGTEIDGESTKRLYLFGAKTNGNQYNPQFVSEDILDVSGVGVITYEAEYGGAQDIPAVAFATTFINDEGQGQYFFYEKSAPITLANGYAFSTKRLRCSYIENQYLTISANRKSNSGTFDGKAYLQFGFYNDVKKIEFDMAKWGAKEGFTDDATLIVTCSDDGNNWTTRMKYNVKDLSSPKTNMKRYTILCGKGEYIKIIVQTTPMATGANKGRIVFDNFKIYY